MRMMCSNVAPDGSLDRETDLISPLVTPLTYEGLVDDTFSIENGKIAVDSSILGTEDVELGKGPVAARGMCSCSFYCLFCV